MAPLSLSSVANLWTVTRPGIIGRWIHSGLKTMTSQEVATALRPFIFFVHPDRFWNHPKEKIQNERSLKKLNEFLDAKLTHRMVNEEETITFYIRDNSDGPVVRLRKVDIKLSHRENLSINVHRILSQCQLPTDYLKKISQQTNNPEMRQNSKRATTNNNDSLKRTVYRHENEFYYSKDLFEEIEAQFLKKKLELTLTEWLEKNHSEAQAKLTASKPIKDELIRLKRELIDELELTDLKWNCDWSVSHIRGALKNLIVLNKQYPNDLKRWLRSRTIVFNRNSGVGLDGQLLLSYADVRTNWLNAIRSIKSYDYYVNNLPALEKQLSELLGGISIIHRENNLWSIKDYFEQIRRMIQSIRQYEIELGRPIDWSEPLSEHRLIVEIDSGPLMLSTNGDFIVPASCPVPLLVRFIGDNLSQASEMLSKEEFNQEHESVLRKKCVQTFGLSVLDKDVNITTEQMIDFCRRALQHQDKLGVYLKDAHIQVSMYYSVMHDGHICVPFNFIP